MTMLILTATELNNIYMYYKVEQACITNWGSFVLLQTKANIVTNWGSCIITIWDKCCYKLEQLLQIGVGITN